MMKSTSNRNGFPPRSQTEEEIICLIAERGGSIKVRNKTIGWSIYEELADRLNLSDEARTRMTGSEKPESAWRWEVGWCRKNLVDAGLLKDHEVSGRGIWTLTDLRRESADKANHQGLLFPDEIPENTATLHEGAVTKVFVNRYERNPAARQKCIEHYGRKCFVCSFEFVTVYGAVAKNVIHVHHLKAVSEIAEEYEVDPIADLRPVCPNCHSVLHLRLPPYSIEEVQEFLDHSQ